MRKQLQEQLRKLAEMNDITKVIDSICLSVSKSSFLNLLYQLFTCMLKETRSKPVNTYKGNIFLFLMLKSYRIIRY